MRCISLEKVLEPRPENRSDNCYPSIQKHGSEHEETVDYRGAKAVMEDKGQLPDVQTSWENAWMGSDDLSEQK